MRWKMETERCWIVGSVIVCLILIMTPNTESSALWQFQEDGTMDHHQQETLDPNAQWALGTQGKTKTRKNSAVQCYSCMTRTMGSLWETAGLDSMFVQQQSFTEHCYKPDEYRPSTFVRQCSFTCISMIIEVQFGMGAKAQVRGCFDSIFRGGFNESVPMVSLLKRRDFCHRFNLSEIIRQRLRFDSPVEVCSCRGHLCNGGRMPTSQATATTGVTRSIIIIGIIFLILFKPI